MASLTGPASHFPSIEKKYGHPISRWMAQLDSVRDAKDNGLQ